MLFKVSMMTDGTARIKQEIDISCCSPSPSSNTVNNNNNNNNNNAQTTLMFNSSEANVSERKSF